MEMVGFKSVSLGPKIILSVSALKTTKYDFRFIEFIYFYSKISLKFDFKTFRSVKS